jgi:hypothetical protein
MRERIAPALLTAALGLVGACGGGGGPTDKDKVLGALHDQAQALRDRDTRTFCFKTFPSTDLPPRLALQLGVPGGRPGTPTAWDRDFHDCLRQFGSNGEFKSSRPAKSLPSTDDLRKLLRVSVRRAVTRAGGITRTAKVTGERMPEGHHAALVKFRGDWKVVFEVN